MKQIKEIFFRLILFTVISLGYYLVADKSYFTSGYAGFIGFVVIYLAVELIYHLAVRLLKSRDENNQSKQKNIKK